MKHRHDATPEHVSRCPECWARLAQQHASEVGVAAPGRDRMPALFGCEAVRRDLHLLAGVAVEDIPAAFPAVAHHLSWCAACREDAAELLDAAADAGAVRAGPRDATWLPGREQRGATVFELAADFVASLDRGVASFLAIPDQAKVLAAAMPDGARRGSMTGALGLGQRLRMPLQNSGLSAHLAIDPFGADAMRLEVSLSGIVWGPMSAKVFVSDEGDLALLGAEPLGSRVAATFRGIPPGRYVVEIHEQERRRRFRLRLLVQPRS